MTDSETIQQENIEVIKEYLRNEFTDCEVEFLDEIGRDFNRDMVSFIIRCEDLKYYVKVHNVSLIFPVPNLLNFLKDLDLANEIRKAGASYNIILTHTGLKKELIE